jgi:hypothetical protein
MAKIFSAPEEIKQPKLDFANMGNYEKESKEYLVKLKAKLLEHNPGGKNVGEIIRFPAADGYAEYMVLSMKPVQLVHIPLGDAWNFQYAHLLKAKDVQDKIDSQKAMAKLFGDRKKGK